LRLRVSSFTKTAVVSSAELPPYPDIGLNCKRKYQS
jgi:hypothetical protein